MAILVFVTPLLELDGGKVGINLLNFIFISYLFHYIIRYIHLIFKFNIQIIFNSFDIHLIFIKLQFHFKFNKFNFRFKFIKFNFHFIFISLYNQVYSFHIHTKKLLPQVWKWIMLLPSIIKEGLFISQPS